MKRRARRSDRAPARRGDRRGRAVPARPAPRSRSPAPTLCTRTIGSCLRRYLPDIRRRLEPPAPEVDLLDLLDVDVEVITDAGRAGEVLAALRGRGALGFDIETAPRERNGASARGLRSPRPGAGR